MIGLFDVPVFEVTYRPPTPKPVFDTMVRMYLLGTFRFEGAIADDPPPRFTPFASLGSAADLVRRFGERLALAK